MTMIGLVYAIPWLKLTMMGQLIAELDVRHLVSRRSVCLLAGFEHVDPGHLG